MESSSARPVGIGKVIWTTPVDRSDEMAMRATDATLAIRTADANRSESSRSTAAEAVPQSLSFYTMFYKMISEGGCKW